MGEVQPAILVLEGEESLIAAARSILKGLETCKNLTTDGRKILADLGTQLCNIAIASEDDEVLEEPSEIEELLNQVQERVMKWEEDQSMIWDCGPGEALDFLNAVDEARKLTEKLESLNLSSGSEEKELLQKAHDIVHTAMVRLEAEFRHLLVQNRQPFEPGHMSFRSTEDDSLDDSSIISFGDDSVDDVNQQESIGKASEEYIIALVNPDVIPDLQSIANLMFDSNYGRECSQSYASVRKDALEDCLFVLEVEKHSIEDVLKMEWTTLNSKIRRWIWTVKIFIRGYLTSEKWLCDQIFRDLTSVGTDCFVESSKASILQLLNFGDAIAVGPHQPEKLIRILDMYEVLAEVTIDINLLYVGEAGSFIGTQSQDILRRLGDCAKATFVEFENAVGTNTSSNPFRGGGIHHMTRYVMNYLQTLSGYSKTLDVLLKDHEHDYPDSSSPDTSPVSELENNGESSSASPVAFYFRSLLSVLQCNLDEKSKLYKDDAIGHLFLMNNVHYMAEKAKSSGLRTILGDEWIRKHNWKFQQHAMNYERASWSSILALLKDDGLYNPGSNSISKTILRDRLQSFYLSFEDVYRSQTGWSVPDYQLREDLHISISLKVIQAYRTFVGRHGNHISDRHIKYNADELENFLLDLFEGSPRSLHFSHRKPS